MSFAEDVESEVKRIFRSRWTPSKATTVPAPDSIALESNDAREIETGVVLYADLSASTTMVESRTREVAAEVYRAFLYSAAQIIRSQGGDITAYDGDRIMAVYMTSTPRGDAAKSALMINFAVRKLINLALKDQYGDNAYQMRHVVGIDVSSLFVARTGVRGDNDLVWVGRAANYAAKLTEISNDDATFITGDVYDGMKDHVKIGGDPKRDMWRQRQWSAMNNMRVFSSNWTWTL